MSLRTKFALRCPRNNENVWWMHSKWLVLLLPNSHISPNKRFQCFRWFMRSWYISFETIPKKLHFSQLNLYETKWTTENGAIKFQMTLLRMSYRWDEINEASIDDTFMLHHRHGPKLHWQTSIEVNFRHEFKDSGRNFQPRQVWKFPIIAETRTRRDLSPMLMRFRRHITWKNLTSRGFTEIPKHNSQFPYTCRPFITNQFEPFSFFQRSKKLFYNLIICHATKLLIKRRKWRVGWWRHLL